MKSIISILFLLLLHGTVNSQNLISNGGFEDHYGTCPSTATCVYLSSSCDTITDYGQVYCAVKDWMAMALSPDVYDRGCNSDFGFPNNFCANYIYPHTGSTCIGFVSMVLDPAYPTLREYAQNKLTSSLKAGHRYQFSMWVQLSDSIQWPQSGEKMAGINSFSALFTVNPFSYWQNGYFPFWLYHPQVQINQLVTDTQNWVLLVDTFVATGGERYVTISNFKRNDSIQYSIVIDKNTGLYAYSYYFMDDVSLIDLDKDEPIDTPKVDTPVVIRSEELRIYPNPCSSTLEIEELKWGIRSIAIINTLGQTVKTISTIQHPITISVADLPSAVYFVKAIDSIGLAHKAKFVRE